MELFRIIWVPNRDHYGSVGVNMVYWGLLGNHLGVRGSVRVSGSSGIYWASEGLGSFGVSGESLDVPIYHSRDLYILRYVVNINLMPEIYLEIEILRSVKMIKYNSFLKFILNWIKNKLSSFWGSMSGFILVQIFSSEIRKFFENKMKLQSLSTTRTY